MNKIIQGDALEVLKTLESDSVNCCVTSPPYYGLRDYGVHGQIGMEETPEQYVQNVSRLDVLLAGLYLIHSLAQGRLHLSPESWTETTSALNSIRSMLKCQRKGYRRN